MPRFATTRNTQLLLSWGNPGLFSFVISVGKETTESFHVFAPKVPFRFLLIHGSGTSSAVGTVAKETKSKVERRGLGMPFVAEQLESGMMYSWERRLSFKLPVATTKCCACAHGEDCTRMEAVA